MALSDSSFNSSLKSVAPIGVSGSGTAPPTPNPIRVVLAMASELDRLAWSIVIGNQEDMDLLAAPASCRQFLEILKSPAPDVVLIDEDILHQCGRQALLVCAGLPHSSHFILVAMHQPDFSSEPSQFPFIQTRLLKGVSATDLLKTIRANAKDAARIPLTP